MDAQYINLFKELSSAAATAAERVMELDKQHNDEQGLKTATLMRDDYAALLDKIKTADFSEKNLTRNEYAKLLTATYIVMNNMKDQIITLQKVIKGYETMLEPKLERILNETKTDNEALLLAQGLFSTVENN